MPTKRKKSRYRKLRGKTREKASQFIAEETKTRQYSREQAIAIGISRAVTEEKKKNTRTMLNNMVRKYK